MVIMRRIVYLSVSFDVQKDEGGLRRRRGRRRRRLTQTRFIRVSNRSISTKREFYPTFCCCSISSLTTRENDTCRYTGLIGRRLQLSLLAVIVTPAPVGTTYTSRLNTGHNTRVRNVPPQPLMIFSHFYRSQSYECA